MKVFNILVVLISILLSFCNASRILCVLPTPSFSHQVVFQPIWKELSLRGHEVTVITPNPLNDPKLTNLTEINLNYVYGLIEEKYKFSVTLNGLKDQPLKFARFFINALSWVNEDELSDPQVQRLIRDPKAEFDLVIFEFLLPTMLAFSHRFNCPAIAITSLDGSLVGQDAMGNPSHPALNPDSLLKFNVELTFTQRLISTVYSALRRLNFIFVNKEQDKIVEKYFGPGYPPLHELLQNIDMFFMNANPAFHNIRPTVPAVINIGGGMNVRPPQVLPADLKKVLDDAKQGVIYFSLGTNVRTKILHPDFVNAMLQAMSELPYQFIWKCDDKDFPGKPDNVHIVTWTFQQDILRHPNVKAFVTQGGLQSLEEAISFRKPVVCIPYFGDQFSNCIQANNKGMGVMLDHHNVNAQLVKNVISNVAENPEFTANVTRLSLIAEDQPMTGLEKAVWWTEYVLRHKGAKHLRYGGADMPLYQYYLIDVLSTIAFALFIMFYIFVKLTKFVLRLLCRCFKSKKVTGSKKKN